MSRPSRIAACLAGIAVAALADKTCPEPWSSAQCLGSSGALAEGIAVDYVPEKIIWEAGMKDHSHYSLEKAALLVIDPQQTYAACPETLEVPDLINPPGAANFKGQSPLCCEKFNASVANANLIANAARKKGLPVFVISHIYRDLDGSAGIDNCGRICDYDVLGWTKWPMAWNLWSEAFPWHSVVYKTPETPNGFDADFKSDFYAEKTTYSAMTKPVVAKLKELGVDTIIVTGFMTQFCSVTTSRHAHDLGFKVVFVSDANDGPLLLEKLSSIDENKFVPFTLGVAVADTATAATVLTSLEDETAALEASLQYEMNGWAAAPSSSQGYSEAVMVGACGFTALGFFAGLVVGRRMIFESPKKSLREGLLQEAQ
eukprot:TRINITY_DN104527_c0_g1_i1.p1 TRINITY_DN104527_c0_g1~~TRINITY_DN104527_c0_g1_i1.p1  ORF type:complete len:372 (-),score=82.13 TRINITY_DN104527_c0_g1_i1:184-1299(-)